MDRHTTIPEKKKKTSRAEQINVFFYALQDFIFNMAYL